MASSPTNHRAEIGLLTARVARLWRREADQALADHGLSQATALPLVVLLRRGKSIRQGVLAEEVGIEGPSLVRLVDLLQADGLVERHEDPTDRRAKTLHLTPKGEAKAEEIDRVLRHVRADLLKDIATSDLAVTFSVLQRMEKRANRVSERHSLVEGI
jgi:MarR family transcriptional regulator for hemolysin